ncbi:HNH/ENDO VII family nuclease [Moraxella nasibovis]|uniref:GH-E family nuclease n=1 Tax=Moraxella nasibovis TaxID=2904120 RepID=UPI00240FAEC7|nr:GH-E family nuclease [Moraxella nasibovis]WFF39447.1 HNH/ENDO VII family nuclease [Moraxella nasibovis]
MIEASHNYNADGKALDDDDNVIEPPYHYGHKTNWENRRIIAAATELGWDQATLNDYVNARSGHFELQNDKFNLGHQGENKSLEDLGNIKDDMNDFLNKRDKLCILDPQTNQCKKI